MSIYYCLCTFRAYTYILAFRNHGRSELLRIANYYGLKIDIVGETEGRPSGFISSAKEDKKERESKAYNPSDVMQKIRESSKPSVQKCTPIIATSALAVVSQNAGADIPNKLKKPIDFSALVSGPPGRCAVTGERLLDKSMKGSALIEEDFDELTSAAAKKRKLVSVNQSINTTIFRNALRNAVGHSSADDEMQPYVHSRSDSSSSSRHGRSKLDSRSAHIRK